ncbi:DUF3015 family protein [Treponema sp. UBA3813]|uniref:DUF3015 family protein n=1 Tax=Treponema sp. UBA3813 TaxID=1947715 RepID=UPI0025EB6329|nr:DUF3015 family protein [Treponema sp. UBA3813]
MNKKLLAVSAALLISTSASMFADNIGPGLGRVLLKGKQGKLWEFLGTTLNGLCGNGMFALTTGTLGYEEGAAIALADTNRFIADNMDNLAQDIAMGDGEYLDVLADMLAVSDKATFKSTLQANFNDIYSSSDVSATEVSAKIYALVG